MRAMEVVEDLRDLAIALAHDTGWSDEDIDMVNEAADILEFFFDRLQTHSLKMDGNHSYRFRPGGWPMTHCKGPNALAAVRAAIKEVHAQRALN